MQDPPSLTEMVRNDGAQEYQGNRNPIIDFPELAIEIFADYDKITRYPITYNIAEEVSPRYMHTLSEGFITYLTCHDGSHPAQVTVLGGKAEYDANLGRLIVTNVTGALTINTATPVNDITATPTIAEIYDIAGNLLVSTSDTNATLTTLPAGMYIIRQGAHSRKVLLP